jgi:adenine-specific DNA-methyltransferase
VENLIEELKEVLSQNDQFVVEDELAKNKIVESALKLEEDLIELLLGNKRLKNHFFVEVNGTYVFDKNKFQKFVSNKQFLPDSYTAFKNKIGLKSRDEYISDAKEVVLTWPYRDCVLEGGQTKEDGKRDEIFWNETLAPDQIDRLLAHKVFSNARRIDKTGENDFDTFKRREDTTICDNLVIKGNNLLSLYSLKKEFSGRVKLIYLDPPYYFSNNKSSDTFSYNSNFKLSTWLTFMMNRLIVARELLCQEGSIMVQMNDDGVGHLKVLMDEVFGDDSFVNLISVKLAEPTGVKMAHVDKRLPKLKENILTYEKEDTQLNEVKIDKEGWDAEYNIFVDGVTKQEIVELKKIIEDENRDKQDVRRADQICRKFNFVPITEAIEKDPQMDGNEWRKDNSWRIIRTVATTKTAKKKADKKRQEVDSGAFSITTEKNKMYLIKSDYDPNMSQPRIKMLFANDYLKKHVGDFWSDISTTGLESEGGVSMTGGKKPEKLLKRIIELTTKEGDIVLDFFAGTGTTGAVAHKLGRQYILCEQLNSHINKINKRLSYVIEGEQGGISKDVEWEGGGNYVYCELMEFNQNFIRRIEKASGEKELMDIWEDIKKQAFLSYQVDVNSFDESAEEFKELSVEDQKKFLIETLDKNQLYVNYSELENEDFDISDEDKELNQKFYSMGKK